jgi:hypothetical protein
MRRVGGWIVGLVILAGHRRKDAAPGVFCNSEVLVGNPAAARKDAVRARRLRIHTARGAIPG